MLPLPDMVCLDVACMRCLICGHTEAVGGVKGMLRDGVHAGHCRLVPQISRQAMSPGHKQGPSTGCG